MGTVSELVNYSVTPRFIYMSFCGRSTDNTRSERLWVELGTHFVRRWRVFLTRLEHLHGLDPKQPAHLWLLHFLFLDAINEDCWRFQDEWNSHPVSGRDTHNKSPKVRHLELQDREALIVLPVGPAATWSAQPRCLHQRCPGSNPWDSTRAS